ncbi:MAG: TonB system transport protein ExbD [Azospirillaceae bacterium]|nr:TonB system transport protein ExbD [Azospirillaceae bacterium]
MAARLDPWGDDLAAMHEINVTPFIDVMLVLLIIFMVAAPLATVDVKVDLPAATAAPSPPPNHPVAVTLRADHSLAVGETAVTDDDLGAALDAASGANKDTRVFLAADKSVDYGALMAALDRMRAAGYLKVALVARDPGDVP